MLQPYIESATMYIYIPTYLPMDTSPVHITSAVADPVGFDDIRTNPPSKRNA